VAVARAPLQSFFQNGVGVSASGLELMRLEVKTFNDAVDTLPELPKARAARARRGRGAGGATARRRTRAHALSSPLRVAG
jgi:hypothetical protein